MSTITNIEPILWGDIKDKVKEANENFYLIINELSKKKIIPKKVYHARYKFGDLIVNKGRLNLECFNYNENIDLNPIKKFIIPLGIIINNNECEIYIKPHNPDTSSNTILGILKKGDIFGIFETLDKFYFKDDVSGAYEGNFNVIAGYSSIEIPINISDIENAKWNKAVKDRLKFIDNIIEYEFPDDNWTIDVIYFPFELNETKEFLKIKYYLLEKGWGQARHLRNQLLEVIDFSNKIKKIDLKDVDDKFDKALKKNYVFYAVLLRELVAIKRGILPCLSNIKNIDDEKHPVNRAENMIRNSIKKVEDINKANIFVPGYLTGKNNIGVYSLSKPHNSILLERTYSKFDIWFKMFTYIKKSNKLQELKEIDFFHSKLPNEFDREIKKRKQQLSFDEELLQSDIEIKTLEYEKNHCKEILAQELKAVINRQDRYFSSVALIRI